MKNSQNFVGCARATRGQSHFVRAAAAVVAAFTWAWAAAGAESAGKTDAPGLKDAVVLIVRHAEKPEVGPELTAAGRQRAEAYVQYFSHFTIDGQPMKPDCLIAAKDSANSHRPRLTLEPLSKALGTGIGLQFTDKQWQQAADELKATPHGSCILICWHHGKIPDLARALGADPARLLPGAKWPDDEYGWVLQLCYDHDGRLVPEQTKRINENLMPGDTKL